LDVRTIEHAARVLAEKQSGHDDWACLEDDLRAEIVAEVKAVLGALRTPSSDMISSGAIVLRNRGFALGHADIAEAWSAMIDAAISDPLSA
jgi:hypothetical protein